MVATRMSDAAAVLNSHRGHRRDHFRRPLFAAPGIARRCTAPGIAEVFTATALLVVLGTAWLMQLSGMQMSLGAFLAGMLLADSEYRHEIESQIEPFKGLLLGLFFLSVGVSPRPGPGTPSAAADCGSSSPACWP